MTSTPTKPHILRYVPDYDFSEGFQAIGYSSSSLELALSSPGLGSASFRFLKAFLLFQATGVVIRVPSSSVR